MKALILSLIIAISTAFSGTATAAYWTNFNQSNSPIPSNSITALFSADNGTWIGTDEGLVFYDGTEWTLYTSETSLLPDNFIHDIEIDAHRNVWIATDGGILQFDQSSFNYITTHNSNLASNNIRCLELNPNGDLWVGSGNAGISLYSIDGTLEVKEPKKGADIITLFPNPVTNELTFLLPNKKPGNMEIIVIDVIGQAVIRKSVEHGNGKQHYLNVSNLTPGTYQLVVQTQSGLSTKKFHRI